MKTATKGYTAHRLQEMSGPHTDSVFPSLHTIKPPPPHMAVISQQIKPLHCFKAHRHPRLNVLRVARDLSLSYMACPRPPGKRRHIHLIVRELWHDLCDIQANYAEPVLPSTWSAYSHLTEHRITWGFVSDGNFQVDFMIAITVRCSGCPNMDITTLQ